MFDADGDQKVTRTDLMNVLNILGKQELTEEQKYTVVDNIMNECSQGKAHIDPSGTFIK